MHDSVRDAWHAFSTPLEGRVHSMYLDVLGLVTCGVGNLIDASRGGSIAPWHPALELPWKHSDGSLASNDQIRIAWQNLKARGDLARKHWKYAAELNDLRLTDGDIDALVAAKLEENERLLVRAFPDFDEMPADGQLCILSMAWACGPGFPKTFRSFTHLVNKGDWVSARGACKIRTEGNPGVVPRNRADELCCFNAASVVEHGWNPRTLHWPNEARRDADTEPAPPPSREIAARLIPLEEALEERRAARDAAVRGDD